MSKSKVFFPDGVDAGDLSADQRAGLKLAELPVDGRGMRMVVVPIGIDGYQKGFASKVAIEDTAGLLRILIKMKNVQASFQIMHLTASTRLTFLLRALPRFITACVAEDFDVFLDWALAATIAGGGGRNQRGAGEA